MRGKFTTAVKNNYMKDVGSTPKPSSQPYPQASWLLNSSPASSRMRKAMPPSETVSYTHLGGDIERIAFQQKLLMALARQTLSLENIPNLTKIFEIYEKRVDTNVCLLYTSRCV